MEGWLSCHTWCRSEWNRSCSSMLLSNFLTKLQLKLNSFLH